MLRRADEQQPRPCRCSRWRPRRPPDPVPSQAGHCRSYAQAGCVVQGRQLRLKYETQAANIVLIVQAPAATGTTWGTDFDDDQAPPRIIIKVRVKQQILTQSTRDAVDPRRRHVRHPVHVLARAERSFAGSARLFGEENEPIYIGRFRVLPTSSVAAEWGSSTPPRTTSSAGGSRSR